MNHSVTGSSSRISISPMQWDLLSMLSMLAGFCFLIAMAVVLIVGKFTIAPAFSWSVIGSMAPWFIAVVSAWAIYQVIPLTVTHGGTRAAGFREWTFSGVLITLVGALFIGLGYLLERGVYGLVGWTKRSEEPYFAFASESIGLIFVRFVLVFAVCYALGGVIGAAFYRSMFLGIVAIVASILVVSLLSIWSFTGIQFPGIFRMSDPDADFWRGLVWSAAVTVLAGGVVWLMVRQVAIRLR